MRVACLGGGPTGLYFAISMKLRDPTHDVTVFERNRPDDTFGWGVVLSDQTLDNLALNDPESAEAIRQAFAYWDDVAMHHRGTVERSTGHGFCGIGRMRLLNILQARARALGVNLEFERDISSAKDFAGYDLIVAADGVNSKIRNEFPEAFRPDIDVRACKYLWLGTHQKFDGAFTFIFEKTEHGWLWIHAYQFDQDTATFIVECSEDTWQRTGLDKMPTDEAITYLERVFARYLGGHKLMSNARHLRGSAWLNFNRVLCERWSHENIVLLGDSAATAHFSIGSGSKLAMESAIALASYLHSEPTLPTAFARYEDERRLEVLKLQGAARNSIEWFENVERYLDLQPVQLFYSLLTRSQRISHENLRERDPAWLDKAERWFDAKATGRTPTSRRTPMFAPFKVRDIELPNRVVVSPMAQYRADDGTPGDWHFVHYAERAKGGAGLVVTEMTCVTPDGRITPGCTGLYAPAHEIGWRRIVDFVHAETDAKIAMQLGHAGSKGSTQVGWEQMDAPLTKDNWPLLAPSPVAWSPANQLPREMTRGHMATVREAFIRSTEMAARAGFDWLELHCAHGYLLSAFITPLTNHRTDGYGGSLENRLRFPLEVFAAVRATWPANRPMSVRLSATDWAGPSGIEPAEAVAIARAFTAAGADVIDVSAGQTTIAAKPVYGRLFQTPFSDRIRNEAGIATMAVGNITTPDQVNSILLAGRADLVCLARPHLADPYWTLHAAADQLYDGARWPNPYLPGRDQLYRLKSRPEPAAEKV
jgi:anthraniloyl-CoA monooxygenase